MHLLISLGKGADEKSSFRLETICCWAPLLGVSRAHSLQTHGLVMVGQTDKNVHGTALAWMKTELPGDSNRVRKACSNLGDPRQKHQGFFQARVCGEERVE